MEEDDPEEKAPESKITDQPEEGDTKGPKFEVQDEPEEPTQPANAPVKVEIKDEPAQEEQAVPIDPAPCASVVGYGGEHAFWARHRCIGRACERS